MKSSKRKMMAIATASMVALAPMTAKADKNGVRDTVTERRSADGRSFEEVRNEFRKFVNECVRGRLLYPNAAFVGKIEEYFEHHNLKIVLVPLKNVNHTIVDWAFTYCSVDDWGFIEKYAPGMVEGWKREGFLFDVEAIFKFTECERERMEKAAKTTVEKAAEMMLREEAKKYSALHYMTEAMALAKACESKDPAARLEWRSKREKVLTSEQKRIFEKLENNSKVIRELAQKGAEKRAKIVEKIGVIAANAREPELEEALREEAAARKEVEGSLLTLVEQSLKFYDSTVGYEPCRVGVFTGVDKSMAIIKFHEAYASLERYSRSMSTSTVPEEWKEVYREFAKSVYEMLYKIESCAQLEIYSPDINLS